MAYALKKPFVGVNHIEGHIYSVAFENPPIEYPAEALIVSGGHTNIFFIPEPGKYKVVSRTRDEQPEKLLTKSQSCSVSVIRVDQSSNDSRAKEIRTRCRFRFRAWATACRISVLAD